MNITDHGLHLLPGDSAGGTWLATFDAVERLLVHQDDLSSGPLIQTLDLDDWRATRAAYWQETHLEWHDDTSKKSDEKEGFGNRCTNLERLKTSEPIYIWAGTGSSDQLFLMFAINLLSQLGINSENVRIVQFEPPDEWHLPYCSMATLSPKDLRSSPTPLRLSPDTLADYEAGWRAVTANSPTEVLDYLDKRPEACQYVRRTLERLLLRYPQECSGLPLYDDWLLKNVEKDGPRTVSVLGATLCEIWEVGDSIGDNTLYKRLLRLASSELPKPLVNIQGPTRLYRDTQVTLTDFGKSIVEGRACSWPTNPIDDWIGGVRISADCPPQWMVTPEGTLRRINDTDVEP